MMPWLASKVPGRKSTTHSFMLPFNQLTIALNLAAIARHIFSQCIQGYTMQARKFKGPKLLNSSKGT
jgi:hypothetical protein